MGTGPPFELQQAKIKPAPEETKAAAEKTTEQPIVVEDKEVIEQKEIDPRLQELEKLPDDELRDLAKAQKISIDGRWSRETLLQKLLEAF